MCLMLYLLMLPKQQEKLLIKWTPINTHSPWEMLSQAMLPFLWLLFRSCAYNQCYSANTNMVFSRIWVWYEYHLGVLLFLNNIKSVYDYCVSPFLDFELHESGHYVCFVPQHIPEYCHGWRNGDELCPLYPFQIVSYWNGFSDSCVEGTGKWFFLNGLRGVS